MIEKKKNQNSVFYLLKFCFIAQILIFISGGSVIAMTENSLFDQISQMEKTGVIDLEKALKYRVYAVRAPEKLPPELSVLFSPDPDFCPTYELLYVINNIEKISRAARLEILALLERPESLGYIQSDLFPMRVHWTATSSQALAATVLDFSEYSWQKEINNWSWRTPFPDNNKGGSDDYDIYVDVSPYGGFCNPEDPVAGVEWMVYTSWVSINPQYPPYDVTVAHEFNHGLQLTCDAFESASFFEQSATYIDYQVYPNTLDYVFISSFQKKPYQALDYYEFMDFYMYGSYIWLQFISEMNEVVGPVFVKDVWEGTKQNSTLNEPDNYDVMDDMATGMGSSIEDWLHTFQVWRYFTGRNDDGHHFSNGEAWGTQGEVLIDKAFTTYPIPETGPEDDQRPQEYGASYMIFYPEGPGGVQIDFSGDSPARWKAGIIGIFSAPENTNVYRSFQLPDDRRGSLTIYDWTMYDRLVLVVTNLGDGDHDPDNQDWVASNYTISAQKINPSVPVRDWVADYNGQADGWDQSVAMVLDMQGNIAITGFTHNSQDPSDMDMTTIKYLPDGSRQWVMNLPGVVGSQEGRAITTDLAGNFYVAGTSSSERSRMIVVKYSPDGNLLWQDEYSSAEYDVGASDIHHDGASAVYITGSIGIPGAEDIYLLKYDETGNRLWERTWGGIAGGGDVPRAMVLDPSGNVIIAGDEAEYGGIDSYTNMLVLRYDPVGDLTLHASYQGPSQTYDFATALAADDTGIYVGGASEMDHGFGPEIDFAIVKYDHDGNEKWVGRYDGNFGGDWLVDLCLDNSGAVYATGWSISEQNTKSTATVKYDPEGAFEWVSRYDGFGYYFNEPSAIALDRTGAVLVAGHVSVNMMEDTDWTLMGHNPDTGNRLWIDIYDGAGTETDWDTPQDMVVDPEGAVYVTGFTVSGNTDWDMTTIRYSFQSMPTATPTTTPSPVLTPTPSPTQCQSTGVKLYMPSHAFHPGDLCCCRVTICNATGNVMAGYPLFVVLDIAGVLYFAPNFSGELAYFDQDYPPGETCIQVVPEFTWPADSGSRSGVYWYSGLTDPSISSIIGSMDTWEFGWGES